MIEKIIDIEGHPMHLKSTAGTLRHYRNYFGRDLIKDAIKLQTKMKKVKNKEEQFDLVDLGMYEEIAWCMAKTADPDVKPIDSWLDDFDTFSIYKILPEIMNLLTANLKPEETKN